MCSAILTTVNDMIEDAFGDLDRNTINFKLLRAILMIFADQLNLLERKVAVNMKLRSTTARRKVGVRQIKLKVRKKKKVDKSKSSDGKEIKKKISTASSKTKTQQKISTLTYTLETASLPAFATVSQKSEATDMEKYQKLLGKIEEQREQVLRVINKKSIIKTEGTITPLSPIASLDSSEYEYEKLLIVETFPEIELDRNTSRTDETLSLVTLEQYNDLVKMVQELNERFADGKFGNVEFPENVELMQKLRQGASLTDAMGALQISARLEAVEKTMTKILTILGDLGHVLPKDTTKDQDDPRSYPTSEKTSKHKTIATSDAISNVSVKALTQSEALMDYVSKSMVNQFVTPANLNESLERTRKEVFEYVKHMFTHPNSVWEKLVQQTREMESKLKGRSTQQWNQKFGELEKAVAGYAQQVNIIDATLSSQMSNFQEQLAQMHFDLESALDNLTENLTSTGIDQNVLSDLMNRVGYVTKHIERANLVQKDLSAVQSAFAEDFQVRVKKEIEILQDTKSDREELVDALRDIVGLKQLNGLVNVEFFYAVKGDLEQRISDAYKRFDNMEKIWQQKYIDEVFAEISEKANKCDVDGLAEDINKHLNILKRSIHNMEGILGEPLAAAVTRQIYRDTTCISCSTPAHIIPQPLPGDTIPNLPAIRPPAIGQEAPKQTEDNITKPICYPGKKIKHPLDIRAELCTRFCGGPAKGRIKKIPSTTGISIIPMSKRGGTTLTIGTDGKAYKTDVQPCVPCNIEELYFDPLEALEAETTSGVIAATADTAAKTCGCEGKTNCSYKQPPSEPTSKISVPISPPNASEYAEKTETTAAGVVPSSL